MQCAICEHEETKVIETRTAGTDLRRRRECEGCGQRFTTYERIERQPLRIIKKSGVRERFDRSKLKQGMLLACEKRPVSEEDVDAAVGQIEQHLTKLGELEVHSGVIGDLVMEQLRDLDHVAYIRFASVYKQFTDVHSFEKEIKILTRGK